MQVGIMFGNPETTPGGKALKFYSSVRIDIRRTAQIKKGEEIIGSRIKVKVVKNKVAPPFKIAEFDIMYNEGISKEGDLINTGVKTGVVERSGNSYVYNGTKLGVGIDNAKQFLKDNPKIFNEIDKVIRQKILEEKK
jgi:recombination protein RecA